MISDTYQMFLCFLALWEITFIIVMLFHDEESDFEWFIKKIFCILPAVGITGIAHITYFDPFNQDPTPFYLHFMKIIAIIVEVVIGFILIILVNWAIYRGIRALKDWRKA